MEYSALAGTKTAGQLGKRRSSEENRVEIIIQRYFVKHRKPKKERLETP